jgi:hypothetical protein
MLNRRWWFVVIALLIVAAGVRVFIVHRWPNDAPDDGRVYAQIARNVLEQHVYSHEEAAPYDPSLIRLPGYPLFVAAIYSTFGHTNNAAVRIAQALIDTATCGLIALLAYLWQPDEKRRRATAIAALTLAAVCPFTMIYATTILTEVWTNFLLIAMCVTATLAIRSGLTKEDQEKHHARPSGGPIFWWIVTGILCGLAVLFRPDSGLFALAIGLTLVVAGLFPIWTERAKRNASRYQKDLTRTFLQGAVFSLAFMFVLAPWTIRNWRVFHLFQPLAPAHGEMPGEFVPRGYSLWVRTWLDDEAYIGPFLWSLDNEPIKIEDVPASAFDSLEEKNRVAALIDQYNHPPGSQTQAQTQPEPTPTPALPQPSPEPSPSASPNSEEEEEDEESDAEEESPHGPVEMTPEIDSAFGQLARERIARHRFQFYIWLPIKRARTMWLDTHSQYWPFEGTLLPLQDLDHDHYQHIWLPLFAGLTALYTLLGLSGAWVLWGSGSFQPRIWVLFTVLAVLLRLILFSSLENPEPRYLVEFFPFLSVFGGILIGRLVRRAD